MYFYPTVRQPINCKLFFASLYIHFDELLIVKNHADITSVSCVSGFESVVASCQKADLDHQIEIPIGTALIVQTFLLATLQNYGKNVL